MTITPTAAAEIIAATIILIVVVAVRLGWRPLPAKPRVLVALRTGETLRGILQARRVTYLVLDDVHIVDAKTETRVDGTVHIDRDNVTWIQVP